MRDPEVSRFISATFGARPLDPVIRKLCSGNLVVLAYHNLRQKDEPDAWWLVEANAFSAQLERLSQVGSFIALEDLNRPDELSRDRPHFLVTFDDGYSNNLQLGLPVLRRHGVRALFFVSTHNLLTGEAFWFDRLVLPLQAARVTTLDLRRFKLRCYRFHRRPGRRRWDDIQRLLVDVKRVGNPGASARDELLDYVISEFGDSSLCQAARPLHATEVAEMAESGICDFGSHGHRHEILTKLSLEDLSRSLRTSRAELESLTGTAVKAIAYPNGDADERVESACRSAGYVLGFLAERGVLNLPRDRMRIPRVLVGGYDSVSTVVGMVNRELLRGRVSVSHAEL